MTEDRNRRPVTIEDLLIWAYHDQMVHQARQLPVELVSGSKGPLAAYSSLWNDGAPVESSRKMGFDAADDAWRVHDLVMKLGTTKVDCGQDLAAARYHALGQYRGAEPPIGGVGTIDKSARGWPTNGIVDIDLRVLVILHASRATRPDDDLVADFRMKPGDLVRHGQQRGGIYKLGLFCHITADGVLPGDVLQAWALYEAWRGALVSLAESLASIRLTMFAVKTTLPAPMPKPRAPA
jgi:hypothetical protein